MHAAIDTTYPEAWRERLRAHYAATDASAKDTYVRMISDSTFRCPARTLARAAAAAGIPVYLYSFEEGSAWHALDIPYLFGRPLAVLGVTVTDPLHGIFQSYWSQFARSGDPNVAHQPVWPRYDAASDRHMTLISQPVAADMLAKADCDFWDQLLATP
jgi:para-nitrobenzyl esterase